MSQLGFAELVLDASIVISWFRDDEALAESLALRDLYEEGRYSVVAPWLLRLEILNVLGRRFGAEHDDLLAAAEMFDALAFDAREADSAAIVTWVAEGLTAYDAAYVALADERATVAVTVDSQILAVAPSSALDPGAAVVLLTEAGEENQ